MSPDAWRKPYKDLGPWRRFFRRNGSPLVIVILSMTVVGLGTVYWGLEEQGQCAENYSKAQVAAQVPRAGAAVIADDATRDLWLKMEELIVNHDKIDPLKARGQFLVALEKYKKVTAELSDVRTAVPIPTSFCPAAP